MDCIDLRDAVASLMETHLPGVEYQAYANHVAAVRHYGSLWVQPSLFVARVHPRSGESVAGQGTTPEAALADFEANALPVLVERFAPKRSAEEISAELNRELAKV